MKRRTARSLLLALVTAVLGAGFVLTGAPAIATTTSTIDTTPSWDGSTEIQPFGQDGTQTYGQTITASDTDNELQSFSFYMDLPSTVVFRGAVYAWDEAAGHATGSALYQSDPRSTAGTGIEQVTFDTGGITLTSGQQYVLFATATEDSGSGSGGWGLIESDVYGGGALVFYNDANNADLTTTQWDSIDFWGEGSEMAFTADFGPPTPTSLLSVSPSSADSSFGTPVTLTETLSGPDGGAAPTGTVDFTSNGQSISPDCDAAAVTTSDGVSSASCTTSGLAQGSDALQAVYSGDANYGGVTDSQDYENLYVPTTSLSASPSDGSTPGSPVTLTATVLSVGGTSPSGTVAFTSNGQSISPDCDAATVSTTAGLSTATCTTSDLAAGADALAAQYSGDSNYHPGQPGTLSYTVKSSSSVQLAFSANPADEGSAVTVTATVSPAVSGTVQFALDGADYGSPVAVSGDDATAQVTLPSSLSAGSHQVGATFSGNDSYAGSSAEQSLTVDAPTQTTTPTTTTLSPTTVTAGTAVSFTATVSPLPDSGTVQFAINGVLWGTPVAVDTTTGQASSAPVSLPAGDYTVAATYSGSTSSTGFASSADTETVHAVLSPGAKPPTITAHLASAHAKTRYGWFRSPVTVSFQCVAGTSPVNAKGCPKPVTLRTSGAHLAITGTVTDTDGQHASVTVHVKLDRQRPHVSVGGVHKGATYTKAPTLHCHASDALSGVARCTLHTSKKHTRTGVTVKYTATATDKAGNTKKTHGHYKLNK